MVSDSEIYGWVGKYTFNYIRKRLGVSSKQAELICSGEIGAFKELIGFAIMSEPKPAANYILEIEKYLGRSRAHCALILGLNVDRYKKIVDGEAVDCSLWRYLELLAENKNLIDNIIGVNNG